MLQTVTLHLQVWPAAGQSPETVVLAKGSWTKPAEKAATSDASGLAAQYLMMGGWVSDHAVIEPARWKTLACVHRAQRSRRSPRAQTLLRGTPKRVHASARILSPFGNRRSLTLTRHDASWLSWTRPLLQSNEISLNFRRRSRIRGLSLVVPTGHRLALVGRNAIW